MITDCKHLVCVARYVIRLTQYRHSRLEELSVYIIKIIIRVKYPLFWYRTSPILKRNFVSVILYLSPTPENTLGFQVQELVRLHD